MWGQLLNHAKSKQSIVVCLLTVWRWCLLSWHFSFLMLSFFWHQDKKKGGLKGLLLNKCSVGNMVNGVFLTSEFGTLQKSLQRIWFGCTEKRMPSIKEQYRGLLLVNYQVIEKKKKKEKKNKLITTQQWQRSAWISLSGKINAIFMAFSYITIICYLILFFPDADLSVESWTVKVWSFALVEKKRNTNGRMQRPASATCVEKEHDDLYFNALLRKRIATSNPHQLLSPHARRSRSWRIQVSRFHVVDQAAACMAGKLWGKSAKQKCGQNVGSASWTGVERSQVVMVLISAQE